MPNGSPACADGVAPAPAKKIPWRTKKRRTVAPGQTHCLPGISIRAHALEALTDNERSMKDHHIERMWATQLGRGQPPSGTEAMGEQAMQLRLRKIAYLLLTRMKRDGLLA